MARKGARRFSVLDVWMNRERVAVWEQRGEVHTLAYGEDWSNSPQGRPLSLSLPLLPPGGQHRGAYVEAFFENLLPDSTQIRRRIKERLGARSTAAFDLLVEIGRDCAGAVQLVPSGEDPGEIRQIEAMPLTDEAVAEHLRSVSIDNPLGQRAAGSFRISLAGAQEKTALLRHEGQWCLPLGATPTTHLFKLPLGRVGKMRADFASSVENEWLCSEIVRAFGLRIAQTQVASFEDQKALIVERFDRQLATGSGWWLRLPQEDLCQARGLQPDRKYESDGGPGALSILELLQASETPDTDREEFFHAQLVFWMLAAIDGHAKNFSLRIEARGAFRMTPLYDVMSAYPVMGRGPNQLDPRRASLAMAVVSTNRHYRLSEILPRHWLEMGKRCGVDARSIIDKTLQCLPEVLKVVNKALPAGFPDEVSSPVLGGLERAAGVLERG